MRQFSTAFFLVFLVAAGVVAEVSPRIHQLARDAVAGDPWAQLNLGAAYDNGSGGLALDPVLAVQWYRRAAEAGLAEAQFNLAHCLATGSGTARDDVAALEWMQRAAEQGLASAQYLAGVMRVEGIGAPADRAQALQWLEKASANGNLDATTLLERLRNDATK
ncbi:MAG: sel1 repeat family protein [Gammaproteobacteria bacterium]|nr:sel1 repeat family protein [Gammaproteobacteria bacterium]